VTGLPTGPPSNRCPIAAVWSNATLHEVIIPQSDTVLLPRRAPQFFCSPTITNRRSKPLQLPLRGSLQPHFIGRGCATLDKTLHVFGTCSVTHNPLVGGSNPSAQVDHSTALMYTNHFVYNAFQATLASRRDRRSQSDEPSSALRVEVNSIRARWNGMRDRAKSILAVFDRESLASCGRRACCQEE
jgi:hypothetical protein